MTDACLSEEKRRSLFEPDVETSFSAGDCKFDKGFVTTVFDNVCFLLFQAFLVLSNRVQD